MKKSFIKSTVNILSMGLLIAMGTGLYHQTASAVIDTPWGPERKTFTWEDPAPYATFNSITNNPVVGDERNFVQMREINQQTYQDEVTLEPGKTYEVYIYYHNNADGHEVGKTAIGIADGAAVKSSFPATVKANERATITATIFASDTDPLEVWDGVYMNSSQDIYLRYIPGTAIIHNGGELNGQNIGPDYLFGEGALLGYNKFSGLLPGCNEYAGYITYQLYADAPDFKVTKTIVGDTTSVKSGDTITFKIRYENTGTMDQENVVLKDTLPSELEYVAGSAKLYNNNLPEGKVVNDDLISENGMNIGDYAGGDGWAEVTYQAIAKADLECGKELVNKVLVSTDDGNKEAEVTVKTSDDGCTPPPEENCITNPEMEGCQELPNTGPLEIVLAIIIIAGIGGAGYYFYRTKKTLKVVEQDVTGKDNTVSKDQVKPEDSKDSSQKPSDMV